MAGVLSGAPMEHALAQLVQKWAAEDGQHHDHPAEDDQRAKRHRTNSTTSYEPREVSSGPLTGVTTPELPWSMVDTEALLGDGRPVGGGIMPVLHLPAAAIEPEHDAQSSTGQLSSSSMDTDQPSQHDAGGGGDSYPKAFGWHVPAPVSGSPLMLDRLSPFLIGAGTGGYVTSDHEPQPNAASPPHHPYSWGDTPMHTGTTEDYPIGTTPLTTSINEGGLGLHELNSRSHSGDATSHHHDMHLQGGLLEPAMPIRRQTSHPSVAAVKGRTLWEEKHGLISPWNVMDDYAGEGYPMNGIHDSPALRPQSGMAGGAGWAGASSTWAREWDVAERAAVAGTSDAGCSRPGEEQGDGRDKSREWADHHAAAAGVVEEEAARDRSSSLGLFENDDEYGKRIGPEFQAVLPELRQRGAYGEGETDEDDDRGAILVWSPRYLPQEGEEEVEEEVRDDWDLDESKEGEERGLGQHNRQEGGEARGDHSGSLDSSPAPAPAAPVPTGAGAAAAAAPPKSSTSAIEKELSEIFYRKHIPTTVQTADAPIGVSVEVEWTEAEEAAFEEGIRAFRKNFVQVSRQYVPSKTVKDIIAYYYRRWKRSPFYCEWKKDRLLGRRIRKAINRQETEGTITSYRELYDGTEYFRVVYDDGKTEELFRYELDMHLLRPPSTASTLSSSNSTVSSTQEDDETEREGSTAAIATAGMSEATVGDEAAEDSDSSVF